LPVNDSLSLRMFAQGPPAYGKVGSRERTSRPANPSGTRASGFRLASWLLRPPVLVASVNAEELASNTISNRNQNSGDCARTDGAGVEKGRQEMQVLFPKVQLLPEPPARTGNCCPIITPAP
jgi:hypothetical protein